MSTSVPAVASGVSIASSAADDKCKRHKRGWLRLAACCVGIVAIWGWLLPAIGSHADVRASIERMNARGINPGAIFYTDVYQSPAASSATPFLTKGDD